MLAGHKHADTAVSMFDFVSAVSCCRLAQKALAARGADAEERCKRDIKHACLMDAVTQIGNVRVSFAALEKKFEKIEADSLPSIDLSDFDAVCNAPEAALLGVNYRHFAQGERSILDSEVVQDGLSFIAAEMNNAMQTAVTQCQKEAGGFLCGPSWKENLPADANLPAVLAACKTLLATAVKTASLKKGLDDFEKVPHLFPIGATAAS